MIERKERVVLDGKSVVIDNYGLTGTIELDNLILRK